jgi:hypothetical protein
VPTFFVVVLKFFKTKPKLLGAHAGEAAKSSGHGHEPAPGGQAPDAGAPSKEGDQL